MSKADRSGNHTAFAYACLISDDEGVTIRHVVDGESDRVDLLCGENARQVVELVAKSLGNIGINIPMLCLNAREARIHRRAKAIRDKRIERGSLARIWTIGDLAGFIGLGIYARLSGLGRNALTNSIGVSALFQ